MPPPAPPPAPPPRSDTPPPLTRDPYINDIYVTSDTHAFNLTCGTPASLPEPVACMRMCACENADPSQCQYWSYRPADARCAAAGGGPSCELIRKPTDAEKKAGLFRFSSVGVQAGAAAGIVAGFDTNDWERESSA